MQAQLHRPVEEAALHLPLRLTDRNRASLRTGVAQLVIAGFALGIACAAALGIPITEPTLTIGAVGAVAMFVLYRLVLEGQLRAVTSGRKPYFLELAPEGLRSADFLGVHRTIPWETIAAVERIDFPFPALRIRLKDVPGAKRALGADYWMLWIPGGLGIRADLFGMDARTLIEQIDRYRRASGV